MPIENRRKCKRAPYSKIMRYHVAMLEKINATGTSVDISVGGIGMLTDYPLGPENVVVFEEQFELKTENISVNSSIVCWARKIGKNRYRVGLKFMK